jgi:hypothetical protein
MYVHPIAGEQYLQNALILVSCLLQIGLEYDLHALDVTRADPICMCLLVHYLYENLPDYLSKGTIQFAGILHEPSTSQVKITNPSTHALVYSMCLIGRDADEFQLVKGNSLSIPGKTSLIVNVQCKNKHLRTTDAVLLLHGKRMNTCPASAMIFYLQGSIQTITSKVNLTHTHESIRLFDNAIVESITINRTIVNLTILSLSYSISVSMRQR